MKAGLEQRALEKRDQVSLRCATDNSCHTVLPGQHIQQAVHAHLSADRRHKSET
jgi:hypothetical protein